MDRYTKAVLTGILIAVISIAVKDVELFPVAEAQEGWEIDNELALDWSMPVLAESAGYAYICRSNLIPNSAKAGDHGYLYVEFRGEPQCMGDYIGNAYLFSDGATHAWSSAPYLQSENQLMYYADATARAADTGQRVRYVACSSEKNLCLKYIAFRGDPADVADAYSF